MNWKQMKAISAAGALSLAMLATSTAQTAPAPAQDNNQAPSATAPGAPAKGKRAKAKRDEFAKLNLTDDQKAQMKSIRDNAFQQRKAIMSDTTTNDAQKKAKLRGIRRDTRKQIMGVLTPEQRAQLKQDMKERRQARQKAQQPS